MICRASGHQEDRGAEQRADRHGSPGQPVGDHSSSAVWRSLLRPWFLTDSVLVSGVVMPPLLRWKGGREPKAEATLRTFCSMPEQRPRLERHEAGVLGSL